jgi:hypothetical protein
MQLLSSGRVVMIQDMGALDATNDGRIYKSPFEQPGPSADADSHDGVFGWLRRGRLDSGRRDVATKFLFAESSEFATAFYGIDGFGLPHAEIIVLAIG